MLESLWNKSSFGKININIFFNEATLNYDYFKYEFITKINKMG